MSYDYIIVGGGASGCVVANRLSKDPNTRVLVLDAGPKDTSMWIHIPCTFVKLLETPKTSIAYIATPSKSVNGRAIVVPQGKVLGGGSSVNAMCYIRGNKKDYDAWEEMGNKGWSYKDVLPVYKDLENNQRFSNKYHGSEGELMVSDRRYTNRVSSAFIKASQEVGIAYNDDFNGEKQDGIGFYQTTTGQGKRCSAATAFLHPVKHRSNLEIRTECKVAKVLFEGKTAVGVALQSGEQIRCNKEVIMCAGAIETPRLLQLSGVGNKKELAQHGIDCVVNLPGVGENYQDHLQVRVLAELNKPISFLGEDKGVKSVKNMVQYMLTKTGVLSSNVLEAGGFINVSGDPYGPDIQFHILPLLLKGPERSLLNKHGVSISPCFLRPKSRGSVKLQSADPTAPAVFNTGALDAQEDVDLLVKGVKKVLEIVEAPSLKKHMTQILELGKTDDKGLEDFVRNVASTVYHPVGTCKMGPKDDKMAVVNNTLSVYGVSGLRVGDASIMPKIVSGNTNAPSMMIGERCARFILKQNV